MLNALKLSQGLSESGFHQKTRIIEALSLSLFRRESGKQLCQGFCKRQQSRAMSWFDTAKPVRSTSLWQHPSTTTTSTKHSPPVARRPLRILFHLLSVFALLLASCPFCRIRPPPSLPSVNISWGVLENYEVVRKIGAPDPPPARARPS